MVSSDTSTNEQQRRYILGEFYFKKGNLTSAKDIFTKLVAESPNSFPFPYYLGKIESSLGNFDQAIPHLEKTRSINPFHKPTLLLLSNCYLKIGKIQEALECMVDSYLLSKEIKDRRIDVYKKKIRTLAKKMPGMDDKQKNKLIKDRLKNLHEQLQNLEKEPIAAQPEANSVTLIEPAESPVLNIEVEEEPTIAIEAKVIEEASLQDTNALMAEIEEADDSQNVINHDFGLENHPDIDFTRHILFKSLSVQEIEKIGKFSSIQTFAKDEIIHHPLEPIYGFSCLLDGKIRILHQSQDLLELESGSIIDEAELCNGSKYFFESQALEPSTIFLINKAALLTLCKRKHELAVHFLWHFYKSLGLKITSIMESIMLQNPSEDVIWSLDRMREISQQRVLNDLEIDFLTRKCTKIIRKKNDFIFKDQQPTEFFYILLEGEIDLEHPYAKDHVKIQQGEVFSEIALISNSFEHSMNAKVTSDHAVLLQINRLELIKLQDPSDRDNYRMMEFLWNVSKKYFEFMNFYYHILKA